MSKWLNPRSAFGIVLIASALIALPFVAAMGGQAWVRILNFAILYVFLALGLNIVVGFAGLLDLGYLPGFPFHKILYGLRDKKALCPACRFRQCPQLGHQLFW